MQILEAEVRLQYALQYKIPYPRLEHTSQAKGRPKPQQNFGQGPEAGRCVLSWVVPDLDSDLPLRNMRTCMHHSKLCLFVCLHSELQV